MRTWAICSCRLRVSFRPAQTQPQMYHFHFKRLLLGPPTLVNRSAITQLKLGSLGCSGHLMCFDQMLRFYQGSVSMPRDSSQMYGSLPQLAWPCSTTLKCCTVTLLGDMPEGWGLSLSTDTASFMTCVRWYDPSGRAAYTAGWRCCWVLS